MARRTVSLGRYKGEGSPLGQRPKSALVRSRSGHVCTAELQKSTSGIRIPSSSSFSKPITSPWSNWSARPLRA